MRDSLGLPLLVLVLTSVACGGNAPLPPVGTGTGGMHSTAGAAGHGGSAAGVGGATLTGAAGASGGGTGTVGAAGTVGTAGTTGAAGTVGAAGTIGAAGTVGAAGTIGTAGTVGTAGTTGAAGVVGAAGAVGAAGTGSTNPAAKPDGTCVVGAYKRGTPPTCACQDGAPDVCSLACTDVKLDAANCGQCGMACGATSACNAGACGAAPTVLLPAVAGCTGMTLAVSGGTVYYTDAAKGTVNKVGGTAAVYSGEMGATWLASQGTDLYWYARTTKTVRKGPAAGGTAADVYKSVTDEIGGFLVTADGMSVYISVGLNVIKVSATVAGGGTPVTVAQEMHGGIPEALALNGTKNIVYPTGLNGDVDAAILGATPGSCGVEDPADPGNSIMTTCPRLARSQGELFASFVAVINGTAFWVDGQNVKSEAIGTVGTNFDTVSMTVLTNTITAATTTADTIYFAEDGGIEKTPLAKDSTAVLIARGQKAPQSIVVADKVYWATSDCAILSQNR